MPTRPYTRPQFNQSNPEPGSKEYLRDIRDSNSHAHKTVSGSYNHGGKTIGAIDTATGKAVGDSPDNPIFPTDPAVEAMTARVTQQKFKKPTATEKLETAKELADKTIRDITEARAVYEATKGDDWKLDILKIRERANKLKSQADALYAEANEREEAGSPLMRFAAVLVKGDPSVSGSAGAAFDGLVGMKLVERYDTDEGIPEETRKSESARFNPLLQVARNRFRGLFLKLFENAQRIQQDVPELDTFREQDRLLKDFQFVLDESKKWEAKSK